MFSVGNQATTLRYDVDYSVVGSETDAGGALMAAVGEAEDDAGDRRGASSETDPKG